MYLQYHACENEINIHPSIHHYQIRLLKYTRSTLHIAPSTTAGLGTMQHEITDQKQERIHQIQELQ